MTPVDVLAGSILAFCVAHAPGAFVLDGQAFVQTAYECPLVRTAAVFRILQQSCPDPSERHTVALVDEEKRIAWVLNRYGGIDLAMIDAEMRVYLPSCQIDTGPPIAP